MRVPFGGNGRGGRSDQATSFPSIRFPFFFFFFFISTSYFTFDNPRERAASRYDFVVLSSPTFVIEDRPWLGAGRERWEDVFWVSREISASAHFFKNQKPKTKKKEKKKGKKK